MQIPGIIKKKMEREILGVLFILSVVIFGILAVLDIKRTTHFLLEQESQTIELMALTMKKSIQDMMVTGNAHIVGRWVNDLKAIEQTKSIQVLNKDGTEAFRDNKTIEEVNRFVGREIFWKAYSGKANGALLESDPFSSAKFKEVIDTGSAITYLETLKEVEVMTQLTPIDNELRCLSCHGYDKHKVRAVLRISIPVNGVRALIKQRARGILFIYLAAVIITVIVLKRALRRIAVQPIQSILKSVEAVSQGNFSKQVDMKLFKSDNEISRLAAAFNTMSETIEAEFKEIKAAEGELRYLASFPEMNPHPVIECAENGSIEYTNTAAMRLFKAMTEDDIRGLVSLNSEEKMKLKNEGHAYFEAAVGKAVYGKYCDYITDKDVIRIYFYDITVQEQAEEALKRYNETLEEKIKERTKELEASYLEVSKYFNAIEQAAEAILITNINGIIEYVNPAVTRTTGFGKTEVLGKNPKLFNSGNNPPGMFNGMWKTIRSGRVWHGTVINKKKSGELYNEEMTVTPIKNLDGKLINFIAIKNDVTARVRAEEELRRKNVELEFARDEAEAANRAKSEFLANMSHELKTPLNHIMGFSELIHEGLAGPLTDKQREYSGDIMGSGAHLLLMINEILELSKIEAGQVELEFNEFDLGKMLEGLLATFREKALKHNIKTSLDIGAGSLAVLADEKKLKQIVSNLLSNAFKFTPDGGSVRVTAKRGIRDSGFGVSNKELIPSPQAPTPDADFIEISVSDTGIGISEENQGKLFKTFGQLEATLTKKYQGTGLGLYLAQKLVVMHGGRIWVESKEGKGSKFTFTVALKKQTVAYE